MNIESVTLNMMWRNKLQVILIYHRKKQVNVNNLLVWPGRTIKSPWPNKQNCSSVIAYLNKSAERRLDSKSNTKNKFYVTQLLVTPNGDFMKPVIFSTLKAECAEKCNAIFTDWLSRRQAGNHAENIVIADFVELFNFIPTVLKLNTDLAQALKSSK